MKRINENRFPIILASVLLLPIFSVVYFTNNNGSGHLYIAYVMRELLAGNELFSRFFECNSLAVPNSTGHWIIAGLLGFTSPQIATKLMLAITFLAYFASALYLRHQIQGVRSRTLATLFAALMALNWFWFQGGYNQTLATAGFAFGVALVYRWRTEFTFRRIIALSLITLGVYFSHLVSFVFLAGGILFLSAWQDRHKAKRAVPAAILTIAPAIPLLIFHLLNGSRNGEPFIPHWRGLESWIDFPGWLRYLVAADPFAIASRKSLPFTDVQSGLFTVVSPFALVSIASALLAGCTIVSFCRADAGERKRLSPLYVLVAGFIFAAAFGPGDFGISNGSVLRERFLIAGLTLLVGVFEIGNFDLFRKISGVALALAIAIQFCYLGEFAGYSDRQTREFVAIERSIEPGTSLASITVTTGQEKFRCLPATQMSSFLGVDRDVIVWDNYELGHYLFPVVVRDAADKDFVFRLSSSSVFGPMNRFSSEEANLVTMSNIISNERHQIDRFVVFGKDEQIEALLATHYSVAAISPSGTVRIF
ncbi:MAG: hypothetical protein C4325_10045 [Blastocatellia bacterium]